MIYSIYLLLAVLLLWILIWAKGFWILKVGVICLACYFVFVLAMGLSSLLGWPTTEQVPEKFQVCWIIVREPPISQPKSGAVYLWLIDVKPPKVKFYDIYSGKRNQPRSYKRPYTRKLHQMAQRAIFSLKQGKKVYGGRTMLSGKGKGGGEKGKGKKKGGKRGGNSGSSWKGHDKLFFYVLPSSKYPPKRT